VIQASKLATLREMATSVAHELNQPLNVIRMAVGNNRRKLAKGDAGQDRGQFDRGSAVWRFPGNEIYRHIGAWQ